MRCLTFGRQHKPRVDWNLEKQQRDSITRKAIPLNLLLDHIFHPSEPNLLMLLAFKTAFWKLEIRNLKKQCVHFSDQRTICEKSVCKHIHGVWKLKQPKQVTYCILLREWRWNCSQMTFCNRRCETSTKNVHKWICNLRTTQTCAASH